MGTARQFSNLCNSRTFEESTLVTLTATHLVSDRPLLLRVRFQLIGGVLVAVVLPAALRNAIAPGIIFSTSMHQTVLAALVAHVLGFFAYRRMGNYPGVASAGSILPTFALSYGLVFLTIFFFRLDYSRYQAASSFLLSNGWYFMLSLFSRRLEPYSLAVVPGGDVTRLSSIDGVHWQWLQDPRDSIDRIQGVVADLRSDLSDAWELFIADRALDGVPVYHVKQISESLTGRVEIEHLSENTLGSLNPNHAYLKLKQVVDQGMAFVALVALLPVYLLIALAIKLDSAGPVLFTQERVGYRGARFKVYKFRTMCMGEREGDARKLAITRDDDDRVTRVGRFLRRSRLDELPQAINILLGQMSWIGPRPEAVPLSEWYEAELPFYRYRHIVRPGISGWAQTNQGHVHTVDDVMEKLHYDFYYVDDMAEASLFVLDLPKDVYDANTQPMLSHVNVGTGQDISVAELAEAIARLTGFSGRIVFDASRPDGTPRKLMDVSRLAAMGWRASTPFETGLKQTYRWFRENEEARRG